jgi:hypothetical protein
VTPTAAVLLAAIAVSAAAFVVLRLRVGTVPAPVAPPRGSAAAGVFYAFTLAFAPWSKESASRHLPSYLAGIAYHAAVFTALAGLVHSLFGAPLPPLASRVMAVALAPGLACGVVLLVKRCLDGRLRALSVPEDYFANALVDAVLAAALAAALEPRLLPVLQLLGAALVLYAPLGKLRHMVLLLTSRRALGTTLGRRGVRPAAGGAGARRG